MQNKKKYPIINLIDAFDLNIINHESADIERFTTSPSIHRTGLELAGVYDITHTSANIIGWGTKETEWLSSLDPKEARKAVESVITKETPLILLSREVPENIMNLIVEEASKQGVPVAPTKQHLATLRATIGAELVQFFADEESVHGSLVIINGVGVMIIGKSGVGKSEAVLELIQKNHSFVSDDTVVLKQIGKSFIGTPAELTKGLLEARGIGLVNIPHIYGERLFKHQTVVELVVELKPQADIKDVDRLGTKKMSYKVLDGDIPLMQIPVNQGRSISALIEAAVNVFVARKDGLDPLEEIAARSRE